MVSRFGGRMVIIKTPGRMTYLLMLFIEDEFERMLTVSKTLMRHFAAPWWLIVQGIIAGLVFSIIVHHKFGNPA
jgi:hypothetical protein